MFQFWPSVVKPILDATNARRVIEIGADKGRNSRHLAAWAKASGARVAIVDPEPDFDMERLRDRFGDAVDVNRRPSLEVLAGLMPADIVLIDGDHNWYTVYHELQVIYGSSGAPDSQAPITLCHDVEWPYARRDLYYNPDRIPEAFRQEMRVGGVLPNERGLSPGGFNATHFHAAKEGGPRNGVKTAIEDFLLDRGADFRVVWLPLLFGLAVIVPRARLANATLQQLLDSLKISQPLRNLCKIAELERVEANRPALAPAGAGHRQGLAARSYTSSVPDDVLVNLLKGSLGFRYKERSMLLNPLDLANYLALLCKLRPTAVIEIGSLEGGRTEWLADTMASLGLPVRVISIDLLARSPTSTPGIDARVGDC